VVDKNLLAAKLAELADRIDRVRTHVPANAATLEADRDALDLVAFNLMLCVQTCVDIASHVVADEGWPAARSLAEGFTRLEENHVLSPKTAEALRGAVGLRNVVAHGYAGIEPARCFLAATDGLGDLDAFAREISVWATTS